MVELFEAAVVVMAMALLACLRPSQGQVRRAREGRRPCRTIAGYRRVRSRT